MDQQKALDRISQTRQNLLQAVQSYPQQVILSQEVEGIWTIKDLLAHISTWEEACLVPLRSYAAGGDFTSENIPDHDAWNSRQSSLWRALPLDDILVSFHDVRQELEELLRGLPEARWNENLPLPWGESGSIYTMVSGLAWHEDHHTKSILREFAAKTKAEQAVADFQAGFFCSQAVLAAFAQDFGLERQQALRVAGSFGAGIGGMGLTCGAVTGALMVIGLKSVKVEPDDNIAREQNRALVAEFVRRFQAEQGSIRCSDLLGVDISTAEGLQAARENDLFSERCPKYIESAVIILEDILANV